MPRNLTVIPVNQSTSSQTNTIIFAEGHPAGWVIAKLTGFPATETNVANLTFTANTSNNAPGTDGGRFNVVKATSPGPGNPPEWNTGDWVLVVADPTKISFETEAGLFKNGYNFVSSTGSVDSYIAGGKVVITDVNDAPENIQVADNTIDEEQLGAVVDVVTSFDQDDDWWTHPINGQRTRTYSIENGLDGALFEIDPADGKTLKLKAAAKLDWETMTKVVNDASDPNNGKKYVEVIVKATDRGGYDVDGNPTNQDQLSTTKVIRVYANNVTGDEPTPPSITGTRARVDGESTGTIKPFENNLAVAYANNTDLLTVEVSFAMANGTFGTVSGVNPADANNIRTYTFTGKTKDELNGILSGMQFNATDAFTGNATDTVFTVKVKPATATDWSNSGTVTARADINNNAAFNAKEVDQTATVNATINPFDGIELVDAENDTITLTVTFEPGRGDWGVPASTATVTVDNQSAAGTITFTGKANAVTALLDVVTFKPTSAATTNFSVKVVDAFSGVGQHTVVTEGFKVTANLTNTRPTQPTITTAAVDLLENGAAVNQVAVVDSDDDGVGGTTLGYEIIGGDPGSLFAIDGNGKISYMGGANYEAANIGLQVENAGQANERKFFNLVVRAKESGTNGQVSDPTTVKVYLDDKNEAPNAVALTNQQAITAGTTKANANVVKATWSDPDTRAAFTVNKYKFLVNGNLAATDGKFSIDETSGQITTNADIVTGDAGQVTLTVVAFDNTDNTLRSVQAHTFTIIDPTNGQPGIDVTGQKLFTATNQLPVDAFDNVTITDPEASDQLTLRIRFNGTDGELKGLNGITVPAPGTSGADKVYEFRGTKAHLNNTILPNLQFDPFDRPPGGAKQTTILKLELFDDNHPVPVTNSEISVESTPPAAPAQNSPPSEPVLTIANNAVKEYTAVGETVGTLSATDPNGDALTYKLLEDAGGRFAIRDNKLVLAGLGVNFEEAKSHQIKVEVSDGKGGTAQKVFTVNVEDQTSVTLRGNARNNTINGQGLDDILKGGSGSGRDTLKGLAGDDQLYGENGNDTLMGGDGIDRLYGGNHNDVLKGENGNDVLFGEAGNDKLTGGAGSDAFVFNKRASKAANFDQIVDFRSGEDKIFLDNAVFKKLGGAGATLDAPVKIDASIFQTGRARDTKDYLVYKSGVLYYDTNGSRNGGAVEIVKVKGLKAADIFII